MRVAYFTETYPPEINGVSLTVERCVHYLRRHSHTVLLCRPRQNGEAARDDAEEWRTPGLRLPMYPDLRLGLAISPMVRRRLEREEPDVVHVATQGPLGYAAVSAAREMFIPVTTDFRTNFHTYALHYGFGLAHDVVLAYLRSFHNRAARTFVPSQSVRRELSAEGFERIEVLSRGVDARRFSPRKRSDDLRAFWDAAPDAPVLLYVGRLAAEKNVELALRAFIVLRQLHPAARMVVVGDGPLRARLEEAYPMVHFTGALAGDSLAIHYASADVFLFPSLSETFGNVTLEAMAAGLAVVAFDRAAAGDRIRDGVNGLLAPPGDDNAFIDAACRALAPDSDLVALRERARDSVLAANWEPVLQTFELRLAQVACGAEVTHAAMA